ncbi:hypothetical protein ACMZ6Z_02920 [Streptococcus pluranimalium]|uniref:hypothetical protein n=1 Tax=Streptococcus pluranimalium TaxID=82348 RepID=UPI0039FCF62C
MKKSLKLGTIVLLGILGFTLFTTTKNEPHISAAKNKWVIFGPVDFSDDEDDVEVDYDDAEGEDDKGNWLENLIKNHKTPFSKTIEK